MADGVAGRAPSTGTVQKSQKTNSDHDLWLQTLVQVVGGARAGLVVVSDHGQYKPTSLWPAPAAAQPLVELVGHVIEEDKGLISPLPVPEGSETAPNYAIAYPIEADGTIVAVIALAVQALTDEELNGSMRTLKWGATGFEQILYRARPHLLGRNADRMEIALDCFAAVQGEKDYKTAALALVTELARRLDCDRVSIGSIAKQRTRLVQMSQSPDFEKRMNIARLIEDAMDEAIDQVAVINLSADEKKAGAAPVNMAHNRLSESIGQSSVLTIPLLMDNGPVGAILLERPPSSPFTSEEAHSLQNTCALLAPSLEDKRLNDLWIGTKVVNALGQFVQSLVGPKYTVWKVGTAVALLVLLLVSVVQVEHRPSFNARIQGEIQRIVAAPFDGYIEKATARAGDQVSEGQELLAMEDEDLQLDRLHWLAEASRIDALYQEAVAKRDRAQINVLRAQRAQAQAQLELAEKQLARTKMIAPFDGLVVSGDLSQRLGSAVGKGEELFILTPLEQYRVTLKVRESRISEIKVGQEGRLLLPAFPSDTFSIRVETITPVTVSEDGATFFVVEASLNERLDRLQPGMEGIGKIEVGREPLIIIWTRDLVEWLQLRIWSWT